ncbi:MAG: CD3324 family protein [Ruminococcus sp.]|nr:CD3324 family protein [Ruminococcus sp.]
MSYIKADEVLPQNIIKLIQQYIDGENIYIPKKNGSRVSWGQKTGARTELGRRNLSIYNEYINGEAVSVLAERYYLSDKSIQRIIREMRINESV